MAARRENGYAVVVVMFGNLDEAMVKRCAFLVEQMLEVPVTKEDTVIFCPPDIRIESHGVLCFLIIFAPKGPSLPGDL